MQGEGTSLAETCLILLMPCTEPFPALNQICLKTPTQLETYLLFLLIAAVPTFLAPGAFRGRQLEQGQRGWFRQ